ncbi:MAG: cytochrome c3 family protein [Desulfovibrio sp.]|nr:cytochrome c3 family protein [Desulfovibrio sp.]
MGNPFRTRAKIAAKGIQSVLLAGLTATAAFAAVLPAAPEPPSQPSEMNWTSRPVVFDHQVHLGALAGEAQSLCLSCHHPVQGQIHYTTCAAPGCHDNTDKRDTSVNSYYLATHKEENGQCWSCVSCHTQQAGQDATRIKRAAGCNDSVCHNF